MHPSPSLDDFKEYEIIRTSISTQLPLHFFKKHAKLDPKCIKAIMFYDFTRLVLWRLFSPRLNCVYDVVLDHIFCVYLF